MRSFICGFSRAKSPYAVGSTVIQLVEKRDFSHAYISYIDNETGVRMIAQASHGYVNLVNYDIFIKSNIIAEEYEITCTDQEYKDILKFIFENLGKKYSRTQLVWIGIKKIFRMEFKKSLNADVAFICSEWASRICQMAKIEIKGELDYVTPSDLQTIISSLYTRKN